MASTSRRVVTGPVLHVVLLCWIIGAQPASGQTDDSAFEREIQAAHEYYRGDGAVSRDEAVEHLQQALELRPGNPDNIRVEFEIGVLLSQHTDPAHGQGLRRDEGLSTFDRIVADYPHMNYYETAGPMETFSPQLMVPRAALLAGDLCALANDPVQAREHYIQAMECLEQTYTRRLQDWRNEPAPTMQEGDPDPLAQEKFHNRMTAWRERQQAVAEDRVFEQNEYEPVLAATSVLQYRRSYGRLKPSEAMLVMSEIARRFPGTPMAKFAQQYIDKASRALGKEETLFDEREMSLGSQPNLPGSGRALDAAAGPSDAHAPSVLPGRLSAGMGLRAAAGWMAGAVVAAALCCLAALWRWRRGRVKEASSERL